METSEKKIDGIVNRLYTAHFLASWGDRMWEFALALLFLQIWKDSLFLVAFYGLVQTGTVALFGVAVGHWVDRFSRKTVVTSAIIIQNSSVTISSLIILALLVPDSFWTVSNRVSPPYTFWPLQSEGVFSQIISTNGYVSHQNVTAAGNSLSFSFLEEDILFSLLVTVIIAVAGIGAMADLAMNVAVERDWVVVVANESNEPGRLSRTNAGMKRIDLFCKLMAPTVVGLIMGVVGSFYTAVGIIIWNVVTAFAEYGLLISVHSAIPALAIKNNSSSSEEASGTEEVPSGGGFLSNLQKKVNDFLRGFKVYIRQETLLPALALSFLYLTVLSFGSLMTADLSWEGVPSGILGSVRGISALTGIVGTLIYPVLERNISIQLTGVWAIWSQWIFLVLCVVGVFFHGEKSSYCIMAGVIFSRVGLWMFDLTVSQLAQLSVPESERGVVGGVQGSLQSFFFMLVYVAAIVFPSPHDFWILVLLSFGMVTLAAVLYSIYAIRHKEKSAADNSTPLLA